MQVADVAQMLSALLAAPLVTLYVAPFFRKTDL